MYPHATIQLKGTVHPKMKIVIYSHSWSSKVDFADFIFYVEHEEMFVMLMLLFPYMKWCPGGDKKASTIGPYESLHYIRSLLLWYGCYM